MVDLTPLSYHLPQQNSAARNGSLRAMQTRSSNALGVTTRQQSSGPSTSQVASHARTNARAVSQQQQQHHHHQDQQRSRPRRSLSDGGTFRPQLRSPSPGPGSPAAASSRPGGDEDDKGHAADNRRRVASIDTGTAQSRHGNLPLNSPDSGSHICLCTREPKIPRPRNGESAFVAAITPFSPDLSIFAMLAWEFVPSPEGLDRGSITSHYPSYCGQLCRKSKGRQLFIVMEMSSGRKQRTVFVAFVLPCPCHNRKQTDKLSCLKLGHIQKRLADKIHPHLSSTPWLQHLQYSLHTLSPKQTSPGRGQEPRPPEPGDLQDHRAPVAAGDRGGQELLAPQRGRGEAQPREAVPGLQVHATPRHQDGPLRAQEPLALGRPLLPGRRLGHRQQPLPQVRRQIHQHARDAWTHQHHHRLADRHALHARHAYSSGLVYDATRRRRPQRPAAVAAPRGLGLWRPGSPRRRRLRTRRRYEPQTAREQPLQARPGRGARPLQPGW